MWFFSREDNLDVEIAASGFTKQMQTEFTEVICSSPVCSNRTCNLACIARLRSHVHVVHNVEFNC